MAFPSANKAFVMGEVSSPPQVKDLGNGREMLGFRLVSKRAWKDKEFRTTHRITVFGNAVDGLRNLSEGSLVGVVQVFSATEKSGEAEDFGEIPF